MYFSRHINHQMHRIPFCNLDILDYHRSRNQWVLCPVLFDLILTSPPHRKIFHNLNISTFLVYVNIRFLFRTPDNAQPVDNHNLNFHYHPTSHPLLELFHKIDICRRDYLRHNPFLHGMYCTSHHYHNINLRLQNML